MHRMTYGIVAFLDILGFSAMVEEDSASSVPVHLPRLLEVLDVARGAVDSSVYDVRSFSDSIVVSAALSPSTVVGIVETSSLIQGLCLERSTLLRGGVSMGKHYSDSGAIYSEALVNAYRMESNISRVPRIIVSDDTMDYFWHNKSTTLDEVDRMSRFILRDRDMHIFIDYIGSMDIDSARGFVLSVTDGIDVRRGSVLEKMQWMMDYYNHLARSRNRNDLVIESVSNDFGSVVRPV